MTMQEILALVIVAAAGTFLVIRWRRRGLEDEGHGCDGCHAPVSSAPTAAAPKRVVLPERSREAARPIKRP